MNFDKVLDAELAHIRKTRTGNPRPGDVGPDNLVGLALSGGGIRSASFALGVLQALVVEKALPRFDYLSTVSGGGYIGSALTWLLSQIPAAGLDPSNFPLSGPRKGIRGEKAPPLRHRALDFIRQRGNYLVPSRSLSLMAGLAFVLRGLSASMAVYLALAFAVLLAVQGSILLAVAQWGPHGTAEFADEQVAQAVQAGAPLIALSALAVAFGLSVLSWASPDSWFLPILGQARRRRVKRNPGSLRYHVRIFATRFFGYVLTGLFVALGLAALLYVGPLLSTDLVNAVMPGLISGAGAMIGIWGTRPKPAPTSRVPTLMVASALVLIGFLWLAQLLGQRLLVFLLAELAGSTIASLGAIALAAIAGLVAWIAAGRINANHTSLHRFYRDRLMEAFLPDPALLRSGGWAPATKADSAGLDAMCAADGKTMSYAGPFHLINANVVLTGSPRYRFSGRAGDSFLLSPLHVGCDATGWQAIGDYARLQERGITLASAMATSGAAANPNAGVGGAGITRSRLVSILMTLLNIRLGYWLLNPRMLDSGRNPEPTLLNPASRNLLGTNLHERQAFLQITDGGHFDNTGIYELVRRRCRLIVLSEAGADDRFEFGDLATVIERIRVDFGVNVEFLDNFGLDQLVPKDRAATGYAVAQLRYPGRTDDSFLVCIKPTLTAGLPADLYARKALFPTFPHETTADQFFDEIQFEAYRELGYRLARRAIDDVRHDYRLADAKDIWGL